MLSATTDRADRKPSSFRVEDIYNNHQSFLGLQPLLEAHTSSGKSTSYMKLYN